MTRVFLTHTPEMLANYYPQEALDALRQHAEVRINDTGAVLDADTLPGAAAGCGIVITDRQTACPAPVFAQAEGIGAVLRCAVDVRNIDITAASAAGILVTHATPGFAPAVAELALGYMVDLGRGVTRSALAYRGGAAPEARMGVQLAGATLGVIGYGEIGQRLARVAAALGMHILVTDPHSRIDESGIEQTDFGSLMARSDFVVCLAVANAETENLIDADALARMRSDAFFINLSRGELVDEDALAAALDCGGIAGAAMDVGRAPDQMPNPALARRDDVIATPHTGGLTPPAIAHQAFDTVRQVEALLAGRMPEGALNPDSATRLAPLRAG
ncbi:D-3-phosphoglycerate dehydrogenase [Tranquillimonas rosea]|uniref:D-3-phosphoglycerate dehydrogenase n=1 Tax=Tranquillimonas rosea TaxID=641238 RepID=A0A1H9UGL2_9RHOB|nr:NAD(P)-dependent oxidoreductase [Tranquillimonas rosea]SES08408.1 D-3-phosphoglycerate dehydrogenase [Tranquillimonas rosea]